MLVKITNCTVGGRDSPYLLGLESLEDVDDIFCSVFNKWNNATVADWGIRAEECWSDIVQ